MSNLTIAVDDELIKQARVRAIQQGTSLSAKVREFLQAYVSDSQQALQQQRAQDSARLLAAMDAATPLASTHAKPSKAARRTLRDEIYGEDFRAPDRLAQPRV
jgi:plasmid stability protein